MSKVLRGFLLIVLTGLLFSGMPSAHGSGFALNEGSARGNALGGSVVAGGDGAASMFYNAAGLTACTGSEAQVGATLIRPSMTVKTLGATGWTETDTKDSTYGAPHVYVVQEVQDRAFFGFGLYSRFGLGTEFSEDWPGRYNSYHVLIRSFSFNPNVAVKATDELSLAAGVSAMYFDLKWQRKIPTGVGPDMDFTMSGDSWGCGFNLGARYEAADWVTLGVSYQSPVEQSLEGEAETYLGVTDGAGDVTLPDVVALGAAFKPIQKTVLEVSALHTRWSHYDELSVKMDNGGVVNPALAGHEYETTTPKSWDDVWRYQIGLEYGLTEEAKLRLGYVYDQDPSPDQTVDYLVPSNDRQLFCVGLGYRWKTWFLDLSYIYLAVEDRDVDARPADGILPSKFKDGHAHLFGLTLGAKI